jgi:hypothetical protein
MEKEIPPITFPKTASGRYVATAIISATKRWYRGNNHNYNLYASGGEKEGFVRIRITEKLGILRTIENENDIGFDINFDVELKKEYQSIKPDGSIVGITSLAQTSLDLKRLRPEQRARLERVLRPFRYGAHYFELGRLVREELQYMNNNQKK